MKSFSEKQKPTPGISTRSDPSSDPPTPGFFASTADLFLSLNPTIQMTSARDSKLTSILGKYSSHVLFSLSFYIPFLNFTSTALVIDIPIIFSTWALSFSCSTPIIPYNLLLFFSLLFYSFHPFLSSLFYCMLSSNLFSSLLIFLPFLNNSSQLFSSHLISDFSYSFSKVFSHKLSTSLTSISAPIIQGNCRTVFLAFLRDGDTHYKQTKNTLQALKGVAKITSACHKIKVLYLLFQNF